MGARESKHTRASRAASAKLSPAPHRNGTTNGTHNGLTKGGTANGHPVPNANGIHKPSNISEAPHAAPDPPVAPAADPRVAALALIPHGHFVLTAAFGDYRGGVIVRWVQQVSSNPPLVVVAIEKGQPLSPLIRDSRRFALCQLQDDDRVLLKIFEPDREDATDPFLGLTTIKAPSGSPVPVRAAAWLDCELTRHLDVEGNCELYVGLVHAGSVLPPRVPPAPPADARARPDAPRRR